MLVLPNTVIKMCYDTLLEIVDVDAYDQVIDPYAVYTSFIEHMPNGSITLTEGSIYEYVPRSCSHLAVTSMLTLSLCDIVELINYLSTFCYTIACVVPRSFKTAPVQNRIYSYLYPVYSRNVFSSHNKYYCMMIWEHREQPRANIQTSLCHEDFTFVKRVSDADFAIINNGFRCGQIVYVGEGIRKSWLCIKSNIFVYDLINSFKSIDYSCKDLPNLMLNKSMLVLKYRNRSY